MRHHVVLALLCLTVSPIAPAIAQEVKLTSNVPFANPDEVSLAIRADCSLGSKLADSIKRHGPAVVLVEGTPEMSSGRVLNVEITDSANFGNSYSGRQTYTRIKGSLWQDGQQVASFKAQRNSMGGAFARFKSACMVLGRTVEKLGEDVGGWLTNPRDGATLGD